MALLVRSRPSIGRVLRVLLASNSRTFTSHSYALLPANSLCLSAASTRSHISKLTLESGPTYHGSINFNHIRFNTTDATAETKKAEDTESVSLNDGETTTIHEAQDRQQQSGPGMRTLDRAFSSYEDRSQRNERVSEKDFVKTFDLLTRVVQAHGDDVSKMDPAISSNLNLYANILLRSCGRLMVDTPPKGRELLAGNLWIFIKEKSIPIDISHYNSLLRVMNENETIFDPKKILEEIEARKLNTDRITYQRLIHQYCLQGDINEATNLLETMKNSGFELNETIFASLILGYLKQEQPPSMKEMFDLMRTNGLEPNSASYTAAFKSLAQRIEKDPEAAKSLEEVCRLFEKDEVQLGSNDLADISALLNPLRANHEFIDQLLARVADNISGPLSARYRFLSALVRTNQLDQASRVFWSQKVGERTLRTGNVGSYWIRVLSVNCNVPTEFAIKECQMMQDREYNPKALHQLYYTAAECGNLKLVRGVLKSLEETERVKMVYRWPLIAQAKDEAELIDVLKNDLNPSMNASDLLETFSSWVWPKFSDNFQRLFDLNKEQLNYDTSILMASFLSYTVQENRFVEALKFISEAPSDIIDSVRGDRHHQDNAEDVVEGTEHQATPQSTSFNERGILVARLLNQIVDQTKDVDLVKKAFTMCLIPGQPINSRSLAALIRVHLLNDDYDTALEEFLRIYREHRAVPCRAELMKHCLVTKNPENLQKIMNCISELYGEQNSLFDLAVCCLRTGKLKQAQKIFASPGFRVRPTRVYQTCRSMARLRDVDVLENFVSLTRDMYDVNQEYLYQILIDTYERTSNAKRALHLWNMMQEEDFQPSKRSLLMIANILERYNIEVPFQKPEASYLEREKTSRRKDERAIDEP